MITLAPLPMLAELARAHEATHIEALAHHR